MVIDIEFAVKTDGTIVIYQIRPLAANVKYEEHDDEAFDEMINTNIRRYREKVERIGHSKSFLSDMAFWNPSEIIGDNPHPLDFSIYREIITKGAWNIGLRCLGYTPVEFELMEKYGNKPYINLDYAFQSLIPNSLSEGLKHKLRSYYKSKLKEDLTAHDKIEFEIVLSCYDFETEKRLEELARYGFSQSEIKEIDNSLTDLTLSMFKGYWNRLEKDSQDLEKLASKRELISEQLQNCQDPFVYLDNFLQLLDFIGLYGTPQFATIAREAFVASSLCKSLINTGVFSENEMNNFMQSINTVATEMDSDFQKYLLGEMDQNRFLDKYRHLRSGTYDITAPRYDQMDLPQVSNNPIVRHCPKKARSKRLDIDRLKKASENKVFSEIGAEDFLQFITSSIEQREYFKFEFTKSLSLALELLAQAGTFLDLSREELSYLDIPSIRAFSFYKEPYELVEFWKSLVSDRKKVYSLSSKLILPSVIKGESDFKVIDRWVSRPNFITQNAVEGEIVVLERDQSVNIEDKIVLIEKADPGFDWIFTKSIKALITKYGGPGSHMAIRCAEFNLPAAIGCGEQIYNRIINSKHLKIHCKKKKITITKRAEC